MTPPFYLSDLGSSMMHLALVVGMALVLPSVVNPDRNWQRALLFAIASLLGLRYAYWRLTATLAPAGLTIDCLASWSFFFFEMAALNGSISAFVIMSRTRQRQDEVAAHLGWWAPAPDPHVAILIATYNEELEVLERTIVGALALNHPAKEVLILDDGRRDWLRDYCAAKGVRYLRRPDSKGSKAGNINHALGVLASDARPPDFIAVLDADFVPHRGFISRSLALFHDPDVGLVQTPQHFFNPDPIQHNLSLSRSYPDEQRFFFDHMQPARDAWGIAFCCGTSSLLRWQAVQDAGGFPTESITEDFMMTLSLQDKGWRTVYLNEPLTEGLAPEGLKEYATQRARWGLGLMQIARSRLGPLSRNNLRLRDRWSVIDSVFYWLTTFPFRIAVLTYPLLYWYFNITVVNASVPDVLSYFGTYFLWVIMSLNILTCGLVVPIVNDVSQLLAAIPILRAAIVGLIRPKGHAFTVTAKGGDRSKITVQWRLMMPFLILLLLTVVGLLLAIVSDRFAYYDAGEGKLVIVFWTIYNALVLTVTLMACVELPRQESHVADAPERAIFVAAGVPQRIWLQGLTRDTVGIRGKTYPSGTRGTIRIRDIGDIEAIVLAETPDGARLALHPTEEQMAAMMRRFYTEGHAPGIIAVRVTALLDDIAHRLSFSSDGRG